MSPNLLTRAINPRQYDLSDVFWESESGLQSPTRKFFFDYLSRFKEEWKGAEILDIGCGSGWLLDLLQKNGAKSVEGIEPSARNVRSAWEQYTFPVYHCPLEYFNRERTYDLIISLMTFGHISDVPAALAKIAGLLKPKKDRKDSKGNSARASISSASSTPGTLQLIVPAYHYFRQEREGCKVEVEDLNAEEYVVQVTREQGTIAEIVRKTEVYERAAENAGLPVEYSLPMTPTPELMEDSPRHKAFRGQPITYLLGFRKGG